MAAFRGDTEWMTGAGLLDGLTDRKAVLYDCFVYLNKVWGGVGASVDAFTWPVHVSGVPVVSITVLMLHIHTGIAPQAADTYKDPSSTSRLVSPGRLDVRAQPIPDGSRENIHLDKSRSLRTRHLYRYAPSLDTRQVPRQRPRGGSRLSGISGFPTGG